MRAAMPGLDHPLRVPLAAEIHSRPFLKLEAPEAVSHLAVYHDGGDGREASLARQHTLLAALCGQFGVAAPVPGAKYFFHDFGRFRLKWECHTEFATFTFAERLEHEPPDERMFVRMPAHQLPQQWLAGLQGSVMAAAHLLLLRDRDPRAPATREVERLFEGPMLVGGRVMQGGELRTDFAIQPDGFSRFLVWDVDMRMQQAGRLVQRILEIETYRMMALLGLPVAQAATQALNGIERELTALTTELVEREDGSEQALLDRLNGLAARLEKLSLGNGYRFAASRAYFDLVRARMEELRESRIEGTPTVTEFLERRLTPAMDTCAAVRTRQEALAGRIAHTNDLLRTRVGIAQEMQNRRILQSMDRRAGQQVRLQQAVEGLSVAAVSYYLVGLLGYGLKGAKALGFDIGVDATAGLLVPAVAVVVWLRLRRMHHRLPQDPGDPA